MALEPGNIDRPGLFHQFGKIIHERIMIWQQIRVRRTSNSAPIFHNWYAVGTDSASCSLAGWSEKAEPGMIDVQNKPASVLDRGSSLLGSVPAIGPALTGGFDRRHGSYTQDAPLFDRLFGLFLIVVMPTAFWITVICALATWRSVDLSYVVLSVVALSMAAFLTIIWASLTIERPSH
jgi:hypothetical protein